MAVFLCVKSLRSPRWPHKAGGVFFKETTWTHENDFWGWGSCTYNVANPSRSHCLQKQKHWASHSLSSAYQPMLSMMTAIQLTRGHITMSKQNAKKAIFKTPVGVAQYPWLNTHGHAVRHRWPIQGQPAPVAGRCKAPDGGSA